MASDYAKSRQRAPARNRGSGSPGWAWMLAGLTIGLFVAFLVHVRDRQPAPAPAPSASPRTADTGETANRSARPSFDFYTILPELEVVVPDSEVRREPERERGSESYILQAGSFRSAQQADALKARLALIGIEAGVEAVTINTGETWYRVRIGPYSSARKIDSIQNRLRQHDIQTLRIRTKG